VRGWGVSIWASQSAIFAKRASFLRESGMENAE
jgi:hypothetical protein